MYYPTALVWIILTAYIVTAGTGDNTADGTDVIRSATKSDDIRTGQPTSKPIKHNVFVGEKEARENVKYVPLHVNKSTTKRTVKYRPILSVRAQHLFPRHKHVSARQSRKTDDHIHRMATEAKQRRKTAKMFNIRHQISDDAVNGSDAGNMSRNGRKRRYAYEDNYDFQYDENFDYDDEKPEEIKKWKKYAKNWDKIGLRLVYMGSTVIMITCCCCLCFRKCLMIVFDTCSFCVMNYVDKCLCRDPMYRKLQAVSKRFGIQMDYATYKQLKRGYTQDLAEQGFQFNM